MCGFAGALLARSAAQSSLIDTAAAMAARLAHRGPDGEGVWVDAPAGFCLGHRRLAIRDLSSSGSQPMSSPCGRWVLAFNGEIYNDAALRAQLALAPLEDVRNATNWRGTSDTETVLAAVATWGVETTLSRLDGMFAFALWDRSEQLLTLARDRFGEKPLYYGASAVGLAFGSELKALRDLPWLDHSFDQSAVAQFLSNGYLAAPASIYRGILKLPAGTCLEASVAGVRLQRLADPKVYWSAVDTALRAAARPFGGTRADAVDAVEQTLAKSVRQRMLSDVPVGAFLSGGVDSSIAVALMRQYTSKPLKTFTIGMGEGHQLDESHWAAQTSKYFGTEHECIAISSREVEELLPRAAAMYDEPFSDSSQLATTLVSQLARKSVGVCLTGDGGDELFGGYDRYAQAVNWSGRLAKIPRSLRRRMGAFAGHASHSLLDRLGGVAAFLAPSSLGKEIDGERLQKLALCADFGTPLEFYARLSAHYKQVERLLPDSGGYASAMSLPARATTLSPAAQMLLWDTLYCLSDSHLTKMDRAAMSVGLECRTPYLDPDLFELAWRMPDAWRIDPQRSKPLLRDLLARHLPAALVDRPKMGFCVPMSEWLRGPLRPWVEAHISPQDLNRVGLLDAREVRKRWHEHLHGHRDWQYALWSVVTFQAWAAQDQRIDSAYQPHSVDVIDLNAVRSGRREGIRLAKG